MAVDKKNKKTTIKLNKRVLEIGTLFSTIGGIDRVNHESYVLIKKNEIKTTGNGILALYKFDQELNPNVEAFTPNDARMFFNREEGDYNIEQSDYNIILTPVEKRGTKSTIPLVEHSEWDDISKRNRKAALLLPSEEAIQKLMGIPSDEIVIKFKLLKENISKIKEWMKYFNHKIPTFEIIQDEERTFIRVKDSNSNFRSQEFDLENTEINFLKSGKSLKIEFNLSYLFSDDYMVIVYSNQEVEGKRVKLEGCNNNLSYYLSLGESNEDILTEEMQNKLAEIDSDFENNIDPEVLEEFEISDNDF